MTRRRWIFIVPLLTVALLAGARTFVPKYVIAYVIIADVTKPPAGDERPEQLTKRFKDEADVLVNPDDVVVVATILPSDTTDACKKANARACDFVFVSQHVPAEDSAQLLVYLQVRSKKGESHIVPPPDPHRCGYSRYSYDWKLCRENVLPAFATVLRDHAGSKSHSK